MEQVARLRDQTAAGGSRLVADYAQLRGDTGPLVYPAAHVYIHAALSWAAGWDAASWTTEDPPKLLPGYEGRVHRPARVIRGLQWGYVALHLATLAAVWAAYLPALAVSRGWRDGGWGSVVVRTHLSRHTSA
jgi:hypothetical protein